MVVWIKVDNLSSIDGTTVKDDTMVVIRVLGAHVQHMWYMQYQSKVWSHFVQCFFFFIKILFLFLLFLQYVYVDSTKMGHMTQASVIS